MSVITELISATLSNSRDKIVLRGATHGAKDFLCQLPGARWHGAEQAWSVDATPACAWRLMNHCPCEVQPDEPVLDLSACFSRGLDHHHDGEQPRIRKQKSWRHQVDAYHFANAREGAMLALRMGEGKSKVAVDLIVNREAQKTLVLCPVSVRGVWRREFELHAGRPVSVLVLDKGTTKEKVREADLFLQWKNPAVVVANYETARMQAFADWSLAVNWDCIVLDESHRAKGHSTEIGKYVAQLGRKKAFRLCLTGTPMPHSPFDLFSQARFLDRGIFGSSFHHFRNRYARMNPIFPGKVDEWLNQEELKERFSLFAFRVDGDVLDLPAVQHHERRAELCPAGRKIYQELEQELIADVGSGVVTAANALVRLLRLQQITSGFIVEDETEAIHEVDDGKAYLLGELLMDMPQTEPVVVFCRFRHDLESIKAVTEKLDRRYGEISGRRKDLTPNATMPPDVDVMGVQIQSGGVGIDLTRARYGIYFSLGFSLGDYEQSLARLHRPGQDRPVSYYHLISTGTVDEAVYGALRARKQVVESVLEGLKC